MKPLELESWLKAHSTKVERLGSELVFTHVKGEISVLLPREGWRDGLLAVEAEPLASFGSAKRGHVMTLDKNGTAGRNGADGA